MKSLFSLPGKFRDQATIHTNTSLVGELFDFFADSVQLGVGRWDYRANTVQLGQKLAELLGDPPELWLSAAQEEWRKRCHPDDWLSLDELRNEFKLLENKAGRRVIRVAHANGHWLTWLLFVKVVERDPNGYAARTAALCLDITETRNDENKWRTRADLAADWFWATNAEHEFSYISPKLIQAIGYDGPNVVGKPLKIALAMLGAEKLNDSQFEFLSRNEAIKARVLQFARTSEAPLGEGAYWAEINARPTYDARGKFIGFEGSGRDISEKHQYEVDLLEAKVQAEEANVAKSSFLATMSHEIRTPMNGILGMAEMLSLTVNNPEKAEAVSVIRQSASNLLALIDDILDFSKLDAERVDLEERETDLGELLFSTVEGLQTVALARHVNLLAFVDPRIPTALMDDNRLRQVLNNLIGNAIKFSVGTASNPGRVFVRAKLTKRKRLELTVQDNGIGIDPKNLEKIFENFTQAERSTTRRFGGTGLGLAICRKLLTLMGGSIFAKSAKGKGSTFTVDLPLRTRFAWQANSPTSVLSSVSFLVIGPACSFRDDLEQLVKFHGAQGQGVETLEQAIGEVAQMNRPSVLVHINDSLQEAQLAKQIESIAWPSSVYHLLIGQGVRKSLRMLSPQIASLDNPRSSSVVQAFEMLCTGKMQTDLGKHLLRGLTGANAQKSLDNIFDGCVRVLVAEDDPINQKVIAKQLKHLGAHCQIADNGAQAFSQLNGGQHFDLILTDLHMPDMDGYDLARLIRASEPAGKHIPIFALTANAVNGESFSAYQAGIDIYLTKPIRLEDLYAAINTILMPAGTNSQFSFESKDSGGGSQGEESRGTLVHFDRTSLESIVGDDHESMLEILGDFMSNASGLIEQLNTALLASDTARIKSLSHRLKSAARSVGALWLGEFCQDLENRPNNKDAEEGQERAQALNSAFDTFNVSIAAFSVKATSN